ncbi:hypothetical protein MMC08_004398, partial [Hypocenomyce scalaris]|nr:hypothetical protein [Hypocenomyce scalaris]
MNYSLISATIPCLKPFMRACNTGFLGGPLTKQHGSTYTSAGSYALQSVSSDKTAVTSHRQTSTRKILRPGRGDTMTVIAHEPRRAGREDDDSVDSGGSQQMIIRQTRGWTVEHDTERQGDLASRYPA